MEDCFVRDLFFDLLADSMELDRLLGVMGVMGGSVDIAFRCLRCLHTTVNLDFEDLRSRFLT